LPVCRFIGDGAFKNSNFIGDYVVKYSNFFGLINLNLHVIEILDKNAFMCNNINYIIDLPKCEFIGKEAFLNSYFSIIIIRENAFLEKFCIGAHSEEFINKYIANNRRAGTYVWDGEDWIYKK